LRMCERRIVERCDDRFPILWTDVEPVLLERAPRPLHGEIRGVEDGGEARRLRLAVGTGHRQPPSVVAADTAIPDVGHPRLIAALPPQGEHTVLPSRDPFPPTGFAVLP